MIETSSLQPDPVTLPGRSFSNVARSVVGYVLLLSLMFISPLFVFIPAAIFACGIRNGRGAAAIAVSLASLVAWGIASQTAHAPGTTPAQALMGFAYVMALALGVAAPALIVAPLVERGQAFGRVLLASIIASGVGLGFTEMAMQATARFSPYQEQVARYRATGAEFVTRFKQMGAPAEAVGMARNWLEIGLNILPAFLLIDVIVVFILSLVMLGRIRAWRDFTTRQAPTVEGESIKVAYLFRNLSLPEWLLFAFVIGGLTPLVTGMLQKVTANVLAVVSFLYLMQGLAIFRSLLVAVGAGFAGMTFGYLLLAFLTITGIAPLLLSIAGLFDSFFDFRHFKRKDHPDESHPD